MTTVTLKSDVDCKGVNPKIWWALYTIIAPIYRRLGKTLVVTSLREGKHSKKRSSHYRGDAADLRIWGFTHLELQDLTREIQDTLGEDWVVVLEHNHIHMHWSPIYHE